MPFQVTFSLETFRKCSLVDIVKGTTVEHWLFVSTVPIKLFEWNISLENTIKFAGRISKNFSGKDSREKTKIRKKKKSREKMRWKNFTGNNSRKKIREKKICEKKIAGKISRKNCPKKFLYQIHPFERKIEVGHEVGHMA